MKRATTPVDSCLRVALTLVVVPLASVAVELSGRACVVGTRRVGVEEVERVVPALGVAPVTVPVTHVA